MRILFFGDMGPTGFGTVTRSLGVELINLGHDVRFVSQNAVRGDIPEPFGSRTYRVGDDDEFEPDLVNGGQLVRGLGQASLAFISTGYAGFFDGRLWDGWTPEAGIVLGDPGNIRLMVMRDEITRAAFSMVPIWHYVPIEGIDLPPTWREMWSFIKPIAMSNFGADEIEKLTGSRPPMVYHGVDSKTFHPVARDNMLVITDNENVIHKLRDKAACKKFITQNANARILLRTDSNWPRKRYPELFRAMAPVLHERPDVVLIVHAQRQWVGGDLEDWLSKYPPHIRSRMIVTNAGGQVDEKFMVALYNAADLYVSNSAEGFGLTIAEAMACGTPAVGLEYSAVPEVIGPGGATVPIASLVDNEYGYFWAGIDQRKMAATVGALLDDPARLRELGRAAVRHVTESFRWDAAAVQFAEIMSGRDEVAA